MTSMLSTRRRAEEFQRLVEGTSTRVPRDATLAGCLDLVSQLRGVDPVEPRAEFTASLREQLMSAADTLLLPSADTQRLTLPPRRSARDRRIAAVVGGFAIVGASTSLAVAATSALPGEMLYPLKRAMESAETGIALSDDAKGATLLANATDRLAEASELSRTGGLGDASMVAETLTTFSSQAMTASDLLLNDYEETGNEGSIEELRSFTSSSLDTLVELEAILPEEARDELVQAAQVLGDIDAAASRACPDCAGGITQIPTLLMSAGELAEPAVVTVTNPVVQQSPSGQQGPKTSGGGQQQPEGDGDGGGDAPDEPLEGPTLDPDPDTGTGPEADDPTSPLETLTDPLTGQGGGGNASNDGLTGVPEVDEVVEDVDDALPDVP